MPRNCLQGACTTTALFAFVFSSSLVFADTTQIPPPTQTLPQYGWVIFGGLGYINYLTGTSNNTFLVTSEETDQLSQSSQNNNMGYTLGFARNYPINKSALSAIDVGLTLRYDPTTFSGQVYQYQQPNSNNFNYRYQIRPITQLIESDFLFPKIEAIHTIPYAIIGAGLTESEVNFSETILTLGAGNAINAAAWKTTGDLAAGAGLKWAFKQHYFFKAQYLFQYRGTLTVAGVPVNANEQNADVLFGYAFS